MWTDLVSMDSRPRPARTPACTRRACRGARPRWGTPAAGAVDHRGFGRGGGTARPRPGGWPDRPRLRGALDLLAAPGRSASSATAQPQLRRLRASVCRCAGASIPCDLAALRSIRGYLRDHGPFDVIHGHSAKGGAGAARGAGDADAGALHPPRVRRHGPGAGAAEAALLSGARVAPEQGDGSSHRRLARGAAVLHRRRPGTRAGGLDPQRGRPDRTAAAVQARRELGLADDWLIAGFVGRLGGPEGTRRPDPGARRRLLPRRPGSAW